MTQISDTPVCGWRAFGLYATGCKPGWLMWGLRDLWLEPEMESVCLATVYAHMRPPQTREEKAAWEDPRRACVEHLLHGTCPDEHGCGTYLCHSLEVLLRLLGDGQVISLFDLTVLAWAKGSGVVAQYEHGYRAQYVRVLRVMVLAGGRYEGMPYREAAAWLHSGWLRGQGQVWLSNVDRANVHLLAKVPEELGPLSAAWVEEAKRRHRWLRVVSGEELAREFASGGHLRGSVGSMR